VASFAIQSHVGLGLEVAAFMGVALVGLVVRGVRTPPDGRRTWWIRAAASFGVSVAVFSVLWFPVFWGTVVKGDGNLRKLLDFFTGSRETAGTKKALEVLGLQWGPKPEWIFGDRGIDMLGNQYTEPRWWLAIGLVLGVMAAVVAWRRRSFAILWFAALLAVGFPVAVLAVSNVVDFMYPYLTRWTWVLGTGLGILVLWGAWLAVPPSRREGVLRIAAPVAVLLVAVFAVIESIDAVNAGTPFSDAQAQERIVSREVLEQLPPGTGPVLLDVTKGGGLVAPGLALALEKHGIPVELDPGNKVVYGPDRGPSGGPYRAVLVPAFGQGDLDELKPPPGRVIARFVKPQTPAYRRLVREWLAKAKDLAPGPEKTAFLELLDNGRNSPQVEIVVFLKEPAG
jgi:hypothetical protein